MKQLLALLFLLCCACTADAPPDSGSGAGDQDQDAGRSEADTGSADAGPRGPSIDIAAPAPVNPPQFRDWDCPTGWMKEPIGAGEQWGFDACRPLPRRPCDDGWRQPLGESECQRVGPACPIPPERFLAVNEPRNHAPDHQSQLRYVDGSAPAGGDGSREQPYQRITQALANPPPDGLTVLLAPGTYTEHLDLGGKVALVGACTESTIIDPPIDVQAGGNIFLRGDEPVVLANLQVRGSGQGIVIPAGGPEPVTIRSVVVDRTDATNGIVFQAGSPGGRVEDVLVQGAPVPPTSLGIVGIMVKGGARVMVVDSEIRNIEGVAVYAEPELGASPPMVELENVSIDGTRGVDGCSICGTAVAILEGSALWMERVLMSGNEGIGVLGMITTAGSPPAALQMRDVVLEDTRTLEGVLSGAVIAGDGINMSARQFLVEHTQGPGFVTLSSGLISPPTFNLQDVVLRETNPGAATGTGTIQVQDNADIRGQRIVIEGSIGAGIAMLNEGIGQASSIQLEDLVIRDSQSQRSGRLGWAIGAMNNTRVTVERALLEDNTELGIVALTLATTMRVPELELTDVTLRRMRPGAQIQVAGMEQSYAIGAGLALARGSIATLNRVHVSECMGVGVFVAGDDLFSSTTLMATDLSVENTQSLPGTDLGTGLMAIQGARVEIDGLFLKGNQGGAAIIGTQPGEIPEQARRTRAVIERMVIEETQASPCGDIPEGEEGSCIENGVNFAGGSGLAVVHEAQVTLNEFRVANSDFVGLFIASDAQLTASNGVLKSNRIGVNIMVPDYNLELLSDQVFTYDNDINMDFQELPIPKLSGLGGAL